jgi:hypothetical protein
MFRILNKNSQLSELEGDLEYVYKFLLLSFIIGFSVSLVVEWQIPILLARVRFPDGE